MRGNELALLAAGLVTLVCTPLESYSFVTSCFGEHDRSAAVAI